MPEGMLRRHKVKHYHQAKVVTHIIRNAPKKITSVQNGDHSKMFEKLPHHGPVSITAACMHKWRIALATTNSEALFVNPSTGHCVWSRRWPDGPFWGPPYTRIDTETYEAMLELILSSAVVSVGGHLFRQTVGIPMGFDDSPYMSQSFFDHQDYMFVTGAIEVGDWHMATTLDHMYRVADDVFAYNCPDFFEIMKSWGTITPADGTTPSCAWEYITLNNETHYTTDTHGREIGTSAEMCDTTISFDAMGRIRFELYDKLQHMKGFSREAIRYPHQESIGPPDTLHSTVVGQMHSLASRSQTELNMAEACTRMFTRLLCNGFEAVSIGEAILAFTPRHHHAGDGPTCHGLTKWHWTPAMAGRFRRLAARCGECRQRLDRADQARLSQGVANPTLADFVAARVAEFQS